MVNCDYLKGKQLVNRAKKAEKEKKEAEEQLSSICEKPLDQAVAETRKWLKSERNEVLDNPKSTGRHTHNPDDYLKSVMLPLIVFFSI